MRKNFRLRNELIAQGLITPRPPVTVASLLAGGYFFAAAALSERLSAFYKGGHSA